MELTDTQTVQLCTSPLLVHALITGQNPAAGPRSQWRLLQALDAGLQGRDDFSRTLVDALKSNLHKFYALFRQEFGEAGTAELQAGLAAVRHSLAALGTDAAGFQASLATFAAYLAPTDGPPDATARALAIGDLFA